MAKTRATYTIGPPKRPKITHDNGFLDKFAPTTATFGDKVAYMWWGLKTEAAESVQGVPLLPHNDLSDALAAYHYFREGTGKDRTISYERYVKNDASGKKTLKSAISEAKEAAYGLYQTRKSSGTTSFDFTGTVIAANDKNPAFPYPKTENWQKAIGAHFLWISGTVTVEHKPPAAPKFDMTFTLHMEDKYNFNPGQADIATGIPDDANGRFELTGQAKGYLNVATLSRRVQWAGMPGKQVHTVTNAPKSRQRKPQENRRIRNKL